MANIIQLVIKNFRGIKDFKQDFNKDKKFICLVGRGDSGKTTILEAISCVLSPAWNLTFYDTDFYKCDCEKNIEVEVTLVNFPEELLSENKYGLLSRGYDPRSNTIADELIDGYIPALSIRLTVGKNLEPKWDVVNNRDQENKPIATTDRAKLNCFFVSDYVDRHFSWNKGNPLYSLLKINDQSLSEEDKNVVLDAIRQAKNTIDEHSNETLTDTTEMIKQQVSALGVDIRNYKTTIDFRDISFNEGKVCLHDDNIPFRLKGKGSKRLISIAIQIALARQGGIILIDEIEQGLEPDRIKLLARALKHNGKGQIFITTHSRDVITEIESNDLVIIHHDWKNESMVPRSLDYYDKDKLQGVVRACPEAFFAKKVVVCEGDTEIGICRALDKYRQNQRQELMAFKDCAYVNGAGSNFAIRASEIKDAGFRVSILCDSDKDNELKLSKEVLRNKEILILDCEVGNSIEKQVLKDLPWKAIIKLIEYVKLAHNKNDEAIKASINSKYGDKFPINWIESDTVQMRNAIALASIQKDKEWFKRIDHGEALGDIIFEYYDEMDECCHLKETLKNISAWVDA